MKDIIFLSNVIIPRTQSFYWHTHRRAKAKFLDPNWKIIRQILHKTTYCFCLLFISRINSENAANEGNKTWFYSYSSSKLLQSSPSLMSEL